MKVEANKKTQTKGILIKKNLGKWTEIIATNVTNRSQEVEKIWGIEEMIEMIEK